MVEDLYGQDGPLTAGEYRDTQAAIARAQAIVGALGEREWPA